ncbi:hypothetical protein VH570_17515 [Sphingobium sp. HT1-2]|uniref:hypothetical protein n=1 Tax=Sphingobium sp. HT1-2 TaxID=3111640 RepID=UPI003C0B069F
MSNKSNILPGTFHVYMPWNSFLVSDPENHLSDWIMQNTLNRVDVLAYECDDILDYHHFYTITNLDFRVTMNPLWREQSIIDWADQVYDSSDELPRWLFAFHDAKDAVKFKLTFGGAA